jgi:hypothetical protein
LHCTHIHIYTLCPRPRCFPRHQINPGTHFLVNSCLFQALLCKPEEFPWFWSAALGGREPLSILESYLSTSFPVRIHRGLLHPIVCLKTHSSQVPVPHSCNHSSSGGRDQEDHSLKPSEANRSQDPIRKKLSQKRAGGVAQGEGPEFKPQYCNNNNNNNKEKKAYSVCSSNLFLHSAVLFLQTLSFVPCGFFLPPLSVSPFLS